MNKPMTQADIDKAIEEIDEIVSKKLLAIEQAEKQEPFPVAWVCEGFGKEKHNLDYVQDDIDALPVGTPLYTAPPRKKWVGLTDEEIVAVNKEEGTCWEVPDSLAITVAKAIEAKLKEKNT